MTSVFPFIDIHHTLIYCVPIPVVMDSYPKTCAPVRGRDLGMYSRNV